MNDLYKYCYFFFFFQAEDGIRDVAVTGVQTCALPISLKKVALARALSKLGYCSRSQAAELIRAGRVKLNGVVRRDQETPTHPKDRIEVDGAPLAASAKIYLLLNKPRGAVTTASDEKRSEERRVGKECRSRWSP